MAVKSGSYTGREAKGGVGEEGVDGASTDKVA